MQAELCNIDSRKVLTSVESAFKMRVMRIADIERALVQQAKLDRKQLAENFDEQNKLLHHIMRYRDLQKDAATRQSRLRRIIATLGDEHFENLQESRKDGQDISETIGTVTSDTLPLWEIMAAIVEQKPGIQVVELQLALEHFGRKTSRQAIESALATHKSEFETKVRGREKFVSLKGAQ